MAAYRRVYDSRHLHADCTRTGISSGTLRSVIEYGLPFYGDGTQVSAIVIRGGKWSRVANAPTHSTGHIYTAA